VLCPHGDSNSGRSLERAASWSTRRWGQTTYLTERADFIIPLGNGQAFFLFLFLGALVEERQNVDLFSVDQDAGAFCLEVGDQDCGQGSFVNRDEVAGLVGDHHCEVKATGDLDLAFDLINFRRQTGWRRRDIGVTAALDAGGTKVLTPRRAD